MSDNPEKIAVLERLRFAAGSEALKPVVREQAARLVRRLDAGVVVALLGKPGSGKTALLDVFLGEATRETTGAAGTLLIAASQDEELVASAPASVEYSASASPLVRTASFLDVQGHSDPKAHQARHKWAVSVADIVLWCGSTFDRHDMELWKNASDHLKDHSFLVLTKADVLAEAGTLKRQLLGMQSVASEEFHSVFPTTTLQASQMLQAGEVLTEEAVAASA